MGSLKYFHHRLDTEQFQPVLNQMLEDDRESTEALLRSQGEERLRFLHILILIDKSETGGLVACWT